MYICYLVYLFLNGSIELERIDSDSKILEPIRLQIVMIISQKEGLHSGVPGEINYVGIVLLLNSAICFNNERYQRRWVYLLEIPSRTKESS